MNGLEALLSQLRDIHTPAPVSWWPPAPGWWGVALLALLAAAWGLHRMLPWLRSLGYRRAALRELETLRRAFEGRPEQLGPWLRRINVVLRRAAQCAWPEHHAAARSGRAWLELLDRSADMRGFELGVGRCLAREMYRPHPRARGQAVHELACRWVRRHRSRYRPGKYVAGKYAQTQGANAS